MPKLKVKWAFAMTGGGQPTVVGDWLLVTNRSGKFYALDAKTGCVHWVGGRPGLAHHADGRQVADLAQRLG